MSYFENALSKLPWPIQKLFFLIRERFSDHARSSKTPQEVFSSVYASNGWGASDKSNFFSGWGSHEKDIIEPYLNAVIEFLKKLPKPSIVVDLGCGDFNIGRYVRPFCDFYIACDVVPALIEHNKTVFSELDVDFRCIDITYDQLPSGQVVFIRQVLQHLSNEQIQRVVSKLYTYKYVVLTEHLPSSQEFEPNLDKGVGEDVRAARINPSGVVLTMHPFNLSPKRSEIICEVPARGGIIQTILYEL